MYYFNPAGLLASSYYEGFAVTVFVGIMVFGAPMALVYFLARRVVLLYQGLANRRACGCQVCADSLWARRITLTFF
jgi:hypothetical protein